jgi:small-conductance mechanosensitive channel
MFRFATLVRAAAVAALLGLAPFALAQQQAPLVGIDPIKASLDQIETQARGTSRVRALQDLALSLGPLRDQLRDKVAELEPRLADFDARLKGLGPAPAKDAPPEDAGIAAERARLTQQRTDIDAAIKQVQLLQARADQLAASLSDRRRTAYAETLFQRSPNLLDPFFWRDVAAALPDEAERVVKFGRDIAAYARDRGGSARMASAGLALGGLMIFFIGLARWWRRVALIGRVGTRYGKALAALLVFARLALVMPLTIIVVLELLDQFELVAPEHARAVTGLIIGVAMAALARAAAIGVLAPDDPARRLAGYDDATAQWLAWHLIWAGRVFGAAIVLRGINRAIGAPAMVDVAARMLFAVLIAALLVHLLVGRREPEGEPEGRRIPGMRLLAWAIVTAIAIALLAGYAEFASFIAGRVVFTVALVATLYLLLIVTDAVINRTMSPDSAGGRTLARQLGIDPRRLGLFGRITSGIARALFVLVIVALAVGRWEIAASDLFGALRGVALGIRIGDFTISFGAVFGAIALFVVIAALTRLVQRWLESEVMPHTAIEPSLQLSIVTILGYVGYIVALVAGLAEIGIDPQKIALVAGALSVGIGFGLQSIVSNFVSGLILLAERPIRVGDQIVVKNEEGFVRRISVRATEIETFEKASVIIPNSELITGVVKNWTHANTMGRIQFKIGVGYDSDPEQVREILSACVIDHPAILKDPPPAVFLTEFGDNALNFEIFCIATDLGKRGSAKSEINIEILKRFRAAGIEIPFPQRDVRILRGGGEIPPVRAPKA